MPSFVASRLSGSDNSVFPDRIEIDDTNVTYYKGTVIGYRSYVLPRTHIASFRINSGLIFADVVIESSGGQGIVARGFYKSDARTIMALLSQ